MSKKKKDNLQENEFTASVNENELEEMAQEAEEIKAEEAAEEQEEESAEVKPEEDGDFLAKEAKEMAEQAPEYTLDIPEDEIWTYQIEGLQAPKINHSYANAKKSKIAVVLILLVAISLSIFFSVRALKTTEYTFSAVDEGGFELVSYVNPGNIREVTVDYYINSDGTRDKTKPITELHDYAFNCDSSIERINIGKDVKRIDGKSIYSCWNLQYIDVDDENPYYCDIDGVLYNKDKTEIILYPIDYDRTRRLKEGFAHLEWECEACGRKYDGEGAEKYKTETNAVAPEGFPEDYKCPGKDGKACPSKKSEYYWAFHSELEEDDSTKENPRYMWELWGTTQKYDSDFFDDYNLKTRTYVIPSTVTRIGQLAFAYSNLTDLYIPEGVTEIGPQAIFKDEELKHIYTYKTETAIEGTFYNDALPQITEFYHSIPDGVTTIGSDAFYHLRGLDYIYIPSSVKEIGHHLMWEAVYKDEDTKELTGLNEVFVQEKEEKFKETCDIGQNWIPEYNNGLFSKKVPVYYGEARKTVLFSTIYPGVKSFTVSYKASEEYEGYELEYATNNSFDKDNKTVASDGASTTIKVEKLEAEKEYFIRVRGYKTVNGKKEYSAWSAIRSTRTWK